MKFCTKHWERLRQAIDERGLTSFVAHTEADVARKTAAGVSAATAFDPLLGAHNAIVANALHAVGMELLTLRPDGSEWCPICFLLTCECGRPECPVEFEGWIDRAADDAVEAARALNLIAVS